MASAAQTAELMGYPIETVHLLQEAFGIANSEQNVSMRTRALIELAQTAARLKNSLVNQALEGAFATAPLSPSESSQIEYLAAIAEIAFGQGNEALTQKALDTALARVSVGSASQIALI